MMMKMNVSIKCYQWGTHFLCLPLCNLLPKMKRERERDDREESKKREGYGREERDKEMKGICEENFLP